jgi:hypothetical protein
LIEWYAVDDHPERPAGLAPGNTGMASRQAEQTRNHWAAECLAADLTMLIDAKDLKRSKEVMQHSKSTRAGLTSEVRSV